MSKPNIPRWATGQRLGSKWHLVIEDVPYAGAMTIVDTAQKCACGTTIVQSSEPNEYEIPYIEDGTWTWSVCSKCLDAWKAFIPKKEKR